MQIRFTMFSMITLISDHFRTWSLLECIENEELIKLIELIENEEGFLNIAGTFRW